MVETLWGKKVSWKVGVVWLPFTTQSRLLTTMKEKPVENIVGKGENAAAFSEMPVLSSQTTTFPGGRQKFFT